MNNFLIFFTALTLVNVIIQTIKSLATIKGGKWTAASINAITYALYTYVIFFTAVEGVALWQKALITGICNFVGVLVVKWIEEKAQKDKLWIFQVTAKTDSEDIQKIGKLLRDCEIKFVYNEIIKDELYTMQIFSYSQKESEMLKSILDNYNVKYCAIETKNCV